MCSNFFLRLHTYSEPLERDETIHAVIAHEMLGGRALYSDLWDHKPPAIYVTYAAAELIPGYGRDSIFLLSVAAAVATLLACYFAGSAAGDGRIGGVIAADSGRSRPVTWPSRQISQTCESFLVLSWFKENYRPFSKVNTFLLLARKAAGWDGRKPAPEKEMGKSLPIAGSF